MISRRDYLRSIAILGGALWITQLSRAHSTRKVLYLTFDDGPTTEWQNPDRGATATLLDILDQTNVKATFFVLGEALNNWESKLLARLLESGHALGIHSFHHAQSTIQGSMTDYELAVELFMCHDRILELLADRPTAREIFRIQPILYRRPGGFNGLNHFLSLAYITSGRFRALRDEQLRHTYDYSGWHLMSGDSADYVVSIIDPQLHPTTEEIALTAKYMLSYLRMGTLSSQSLPLSLQGYADSMEEDQGLIILAHDTQPQMVAAWAIILPALLAEGYTFAALPRPNDAPNTELVGVGRTPTPKTHYKGVHTLITA